MFTLRLWKIPAPVTKKSTQEEINRTERWVRTFFLLFTTIVFTGLGFLFHFLGAPFRQAVYLPAGFGLFTLGIGEYMLQRVVNSILPRD